MRRLLLSLAASLLALGGLAATAARPAAAFPSDHIDLAGHGFGHGRGMGQYGALGYALGGMAYGNILQHYYSNTTPGGMGNDTMTVELMANLGSDLIVVQEKGHYTTSAGTPTAGELGVLVRRIGPNLFDVYQSGGCGGQGGWNLMAHAVAGPVTIHPTVASGGDHTEMLQVCAVAGNRWYEGDLVAAEGDGTIHTVNSLPIETYLHGVVPRESPASWGTLGNGAGEEALKAQAVAARSYAAAENRSAWAKTCDTTSCQVYGGRALQDSGGYQDLYGVPLYATTDSAVTSTAGQIRLLGSAVARTEFSSSTGGYTAGGTFPAVVDDGDATPQNPNHNWSRSIPVSTIEAAFGVGPLQSIQVLTRNGLGDMGGRVLTIKVTGANGSTTVSGATFQAKLNLLSDWFQIQAQPSGGLQGYWLLGNDGGIFSFGNAAFHGSMGGKALNKPIVTMAATTTGNGYWLVGSDGGIFSFGDAGFFGSTGSIALNRPIVGMAPTPTGKGYWLVASDGGIFSFGDAGFFGSTGNIALNKPVVGMAPTPSGKGYWLVASDGGIFSFGDATFHGSTGSIALARPIVGMAPGPANSGYWLMGADGGIFAFDVPYQGSLPGSKVTAEATGIKGTRTGNGYLVTTSGGLVYSFGDAPAYGGMDTAVPGYQGRIIAIDGQPSAT